MPWLEVSNDTVIEGNIGYIVTGGNEVKLTLPSDLAVGDIIHIREGAQATKWRLALGARGQVIQGFEGLVGAGSRGWRDVSVSDDGQKLVAIPDFGYIYTSTDAGKTWTEQTGAGKNYWKSVVSSSDGSRIFASSYASFNSGSTASFIFSSQDSGTTWVQRQPPSNLTNNQSLQNLAISGDGLKVIASFWNGVLISVDGGGSWQPAPITGLSYPRDVEASADGSRLFVIGFDEYE